MEAKISLKEDLTLQWETFLNRCTVHGFKNIKENKARFFKTMWLILFLLSSAFCFYLIVSSINSYLNFEVITKIKINQQNSIDFPIIKMCDTNTYSTRYAKKLIDSYFNESGINSPFNMTSASEGYMRGRINILRDLVKKKNIHLSIEEKKKLGIELNQMFISGSYGNVEISAENFTWKYENNEGNCYVFNSGLDSNGSEIPVLSSTQSGPSYGFRLELLLPPSDFYYLDISNGLRMYVGDSSMEFSEYEYIVLSPGSMAYIGIEKTVSKALPYPHSDCNPDFDYSQKNCIKNCYSLSLSEVCNCSVQNCLTYEQILCEHKFHDKFYSKLFRNDTCSQKCVPSCKRTVYELTSSSFNYPSNNYAKNMIDNKDYLFRNQNYSIDFNHLKENLIGLIVYWKNLEYVSIVETPTTTVLGLIANVGGFLGKILLPTFLFNNI
jgi:hypothetical protein